MSRELIASRAENEAIRQEMERDPSIIMLGEDIAGARRPRASGIRGRVGRSDGLHQGPDPAVRARTHHRYADL